MRYIPILTVLAGLFLSCSDARKPTYIITGKGDTVMVAKQDTLPPPAPDSAGLFTRINTGSTTPEQLLVFANTLKGIPYKYASIDPARGFDCSGFITFVFNHFNIAVPRRSVDFTNIREAINLKDAKTGDLILFTGTDSTIRVVGHMGIIIKAPGKELTFIHSTSGKANGVTETPFNSYYQGRYVKTVRIFSHNDR
ncbi:MULTISPECIES: NlpC/P60 family protein [unclassified Mucilaginibacter]|uniref:C40 family peptidase n=1 Tax=unclassified Mucilaginibacter TaxID=2617802 RepID=UPI002AC91FC7|nr:MULTISPECIES: NlpC/P60 family protein [unclassified Mucilaginibacter]MEB0279585.1 NlpC/P60 family protein [Mucilaginibacter sp. 10B2]MEB0300352.1 NlpC/P60 family protein [Mucilaginibacter sp. 5C4]WPX22547.1 NlpC/P60 family protein [Mucilaginibacter sp. 5C4]